jgi:hypothetical protein
MSTTPQRPDWAGPATDPPPPAGPGTERLAPVPPASGGGRRVIVAAGLALAVGLAGGFFAGRATAPKGPATLAEAFQQAQAGKLPVGNGGPGGVLRRGQNGQNGQGATPGQGFPGPGGTPPGGGNGGQGGPGGIQGQVTAVDGDTITVQTSAGPIKVKLSDSTTIERATAGSRKDLAVGTQVSVRPDFNAGNTAAGEVTAASITAGAR